MKALEIIRFLEKQYPLNLQSDADNSGIQIGSPELDVNKVAVAYEKTLDVITRCIKNDFNMLVTHRPLFLPKRFGYPRQAWWSHFKKAIGDNELLIYSLHENLDWGPNNTGICLCNKLGLNVLEQKKDYLIGKTNPKSFGKFILLVKNLLNPEYIIARGNDKKVIERVGLVAGTAMDPVDIEFFRSASVDCFLSGDPDDFGIRYARDLGLMTVNVDDYSLERPGIVFLSELLTDEFEELRVQFIDCRYGKDK